MAIHKRPEKGLLSGLYELPNTPGILTQDEAVQWVKEKGFSPIRIHPLEPAKHIFSHVEWHMSAYLVWIEDPVYTGEYLFVEPSLTEEKISDTGGICSICKIYGDQTGAGEIQGGNVNEDFISSHTKL